MEPLPRAFFARDAVTVARALLGKLLVCRIGGVRRTGRIVETEAYLGERDLASHASKGRTARTEVMFGPPGRAYVYLVYGMHHCLNAVTGPDGEASAVLLRGVEPLAGFAAGTRADGPGRLTRAFDITRAHDGGDLCATRAPVTIADGERVSPRAIARGPRIGVDYAGAWAAREYRFWVRGAAGVSRPHG